MAENNDNNLNLEQNIILNYKTNASQTAKQVNALDNSIEAVTDAQQENTKETKKNEDSYKSFKTQIREAQQELLKLSQTYGETSKEAVEAAKKVADLRDQMGMANQLVEGFNPDRKFAAFASAANIAASAASGVTSGMALFGATSEDTEEALLKVQAAMAFSDSIASLSDMGDTFQTLKAQAVALYTALATAKTADTVATEVNAGAQVEGAVADGVRTGALTLSTIATTAATIATNLFTASIAILAAPVTLLIIAIGLLIAAIGYLTGAWGDFSGEAAKAEAANKKLSKEIDDMTEATKKSNEAMELHNDYLIDMASASGKSSEEIRKLKEELINQEVAEKRLNAVKAQSIFLEARRIAASEDATDAQKETNKKAWELFQEQNKIYNDSIKEREQLARDHRVEIVAEETAKNKKILDEQKELNKKLADEAKKRAEEEKKRLEDLAKAKADLEKRYLLELQDINDKADEEKLQRQKERALEEIENLRSQGVNVENLMRYHEEKFFTLEEELREKRRLERLEKEEEAQALQDEKDKEFREKQKEINEAILEQKQAVEDQKFNIASKGVELLTAVFGKSKAIQRAGIIAENAIGIGKMIIDNQRANIGALATPQAIATSGASAAPVIAANNITTGIGIASSVAATVKALSAVGGGGDSSSSGGASTARTGTVTAPQVGFQASGENQIATTIARNTEDQPPIKAFVVSTEVTTAQSLDRNKVEANSF